MLLILIWDGFLILGEGLGLPGPVARRFADTAWVLSFTALAAWSGLVTLTLL